MKITPQFPERVAFDLAWIFHLYPLFMVFIVRFDGWGMNAVLGHYAIFTPLSLVLLVVGSAVSMLMKRAAKRR